MASTSRPSRPQQPSPPPSHPKTPPTVASANPSPADRSSLPSSPNLDLKRAVERPCKNEGGWGGVSTWWRKGRRECARMGAGGAVGGVWVLRRRARASGAAALRGGLESGCLLGGFQGAPAGTKRGRRGAKSPRAKRAPHTTGRGGMALCHLEQSGHLATYTQAGAPASRRVGAMI